jgi:putative NADH-flavin reductase
MKVLVLGATGGVGRDITAELVGRGHQVTAASRTPITTGADGVASLAVDATDSGAIAAAAAGHDAVVNAVGPRFGQDDLAGLTAVANALIAGLRQANVIRLVVVGGAGTLEVGPGIRLHTTDQFPAEYKPLAEAHADAYDAYRAADGLDWTYLTPPPEFMPGERTGAYRTGPGGYLADSEGRSRLSYADMAVAVVDTLEQGSNAGARIAVAY